MLVYPFRCRIHVFIHVHGMYRPMLTRIIHWSMHFFMHLCTHSVMYVNILVILIYISLPSVYLSMYPSIHPSIHTLVLRYIRTYLCPCVRTHFIPFHSITSFQNFPQIWSKSSIRPSQKWLGPLGPLGLLNLIETDRRWNNIIASWWLCLALWMSSCLGDLTSVRCGENRAIVGVNN